MKLAIRHIPYTNLIDSLYEKCDVLTTSNIPEHPLINNIILLEGDIYINSNNIDVDKLKSYEKVIIFQSHNQAIPDNIIKVVNKIGIDVEIIGESIKQFSLQQFNEYIKIPYNPTLQRLSISISDKCNLRCSFCYSVNGNIMSYQEFKKIPIEIFNTVSDVELSGYGEILLNKDLFKILDYLTSLPIKRINFTTNATLLTPKMTDKLITYEKLTLIQISIDTLDKAVYEKIRVNANYNKVIENIDYLSLVRPDHLNVFIKSVMTLDTIKNLKELITKTHESGFQRFIGLHLNISVEKAIKQSTLLDIETTNRHYDEARELGKKLGIAATLPPNFKVLDKTDICRDYINHPCSEPNETMYIQSNGDIHPCCYSTNIYGNIFNEKFDNIWYNKKYKLLRSTMNTAECLPDCRICGMTEHIDNINFSIKKGEKYREKNIKEKLLECLK